MAHAEVQLDTDNGGNEREGVFSTSTKMLASALRAPLVFLTPAVNYGSIERPSVVFQISASDRFVGSTGIGSVQPSLEVDPRLTKAFGYIQRLIKVGTALSEVSA